MWSSIDTIPHLGSLMPAMVQIWEHQSVIPAEHGDPNKVPFVDLCDLDVPR